MVQIGDTGSLVPRPLFLLAPSKNGPVYCLPFESVTKQAHSIGTEGEIVLFSHLGNNVRSLLGEYNAIFYKVVIGPAGCRTTVRVS